jgi:hypothetical protein
MRISHWAGVYKNQHMSSLACRSCGRARALIGSFTVAQSTAGGAAPATSTKRNRRQKRDKDLDLMSQLIPMFRFQCFS